jgi:putative zinc finger protein
MDHHEALRCEAVEKYLLGELALQERDEFEEHFFDCPQCAAELKTTAAFLDEVKREFRQLPAVKPAPRARKPSRFEFLWRPAFFAPAFALLLSVIVYQNVRVFPRVAGEGTRLDRPEVLSAVSLIGANSRGGVNPSVTVGKDQPILLTLDIPAAEQYTSYICTLIAPSGAAVWRVPVSASQAKDTVSIRIPGADLKPGDYTLRVQANPVRGEPADIARYRFTLSGIN